MKSAYTIVWLLKKQKGVAYFLLSNYSGGQSRKNVCYLNFTDESQDWCYI